VHASRLALAGPLSGDLDGADLDNVAHGFMSLDSGVRPFAVDADGGFELCLARRGDLGQGCLGLSGEDRR
jgi:hypothetical protein